MSYTNFWESVQKLFTNCEDETAISETTSTFKVKLFVSSVEFVQNLTVNIACV